MYGITVHDKEEFCVLAVFGKQLRRSFYVRKNRPVIPGELIHMDACGPMENVSLNGSKYSVVFKDDSSRYRQVFFLKKKDEVPRCLGIFLNEACAAGNPAKCIVSDGGLEFNNENVRKILQQGGIAARTAMPYTPEQNGLAERENRILVETGRSMLHTKELHIFLWAEAVNTACHVLNRTGPTAVKGKSPFELWFKRGPAPIDHFRVFGAECFVHVPKQRRRKWDKKAAAGRFLGYYDEKDGYKIWLAKTKKLLLVEMLFSSQKKSLHQYR
uniref:Integrase catalytic domain-containing protein n=1 Tax=Trichuris muris TaxID=70415 RepID=A0A5S6Q658_TRIMR